MASSSTISGLSLTKPSNRLTHLSFPEQKLRTITAGAVFYDGLGHDDLGLQAVRKRFRYYPPDVRLYLLASAWNRIGQEEHLRGRAGMVGDELGSALIASRLVRDLMRLCFLMEEQYAPYPKWFGTAFAWLACAKTLAPSLRRAQFAETWAEREQGLIEAYQLVAEMHNALGITEALPATVRDFFGRPFKVMALHGFADALRARIADPAVQRIAQRGLIGGIHTGSTQINDERIISNRPPVIDERAFDRLVIGVVLRHRSDFLPDVRCGAKGAPIIFATTCARRPDQH